MTYKLAVEEIGENSAHAVGKGVGVSFKIASEVCRHIKNKPVIKAKQILERVIKKEEAIPFKRFNMDLAHKPGMGPGRYPIKCAAEILKLVKSAESNAQNKGLGTANLVITHICTHKASSPYHYGRHKRRKMKRSNIEVVVTEVKEK
jgi:large subunit ribosomal protein L22